MTVRTTTALKALFESGDTPSEQDFIDWFDSHDISGDFKGFVPLKKFGMSMQDYTDADSDQLTAFQSAINSAAGSGQMLILPAGKLVLDGTLQLPTIGGFKGNSMYHTHIKLADGANARQLECNDPSIGSSGTNTGGIANIVMDVLFNGNQANNTFTDSHIYSYAGATGLTNQTDFTTVLGHPRNFVDPRRLWMNIYIVDTPGIGFETAGRGESRYRNIFCRESKGNAFKFGTYDEFADFLTAEAPGGVGFEFASGCSQFRLVASKAYFTGGDATRSDGDGFYCSASGVGNMQLVACTAQDTHRHGFNLQGKKIDMVGCMAESIGTLYPVFAQGNSTLDGDISAIRASALKNSRIQLTIADRQVVNSSGGPYCEWALDMRGNTQLSQFDIVYGTEDGLGNEVGNEVRTNNLSAGMRNWVKVNGRQVHGWSFTATEIGDATHGVNAKGKHEGMGPIFDTTNDKPLWAAGSTATAVWKDAAGTTSITPA